MKKSLLFLCILFLINTARVSAQLNIDKVKTMFGTKKEPSMLDKNLSFLNSAALAQRVSGSEAESKTAEFIAEQLKAMLFKPYFGQYIHRFSINKKNNLSADSYIQIYNQKLEVGTELVIPPFSGTGSASAQALPGMEEADNLWFIKFSDVGTGLNNKLGNGLEKMYRKAQEAIKNGAEAVMFVNDEGASSDFSNTFNEKKAFLEKPVFILNHAAYKKYIVAQSQGKDWVNLDYNFSKTKNLGEGHNAMGLWQNQTAVNVLIIARMDETVDQGNNASGLAALLAVAERINKSRLTQYNYIVAALSGTNDEQKGAADLIQKLRLSDKNVNCVINISDISALNSKNELYLNGSGTSASWDLVLGSFTRNFLLNKIPSGEVGNENHIFFYKKGIPVLNVFTKRKVVTRAMNEEGVERIASSIGDILLEIDKLPKFAFTKTPPLPDFTKMNFKVSMGIVPDYAFAGDGLLIGRVIENGIAAYSNVMEGDVLVRMGDYDIHTPSDYAREMAKYNIGSRLMIKVKRNGVDKQMLLTFK